MFLRKALTIALLALLITPCAYARERTRGKRHNPKKTSRIERRDIARSLKEVVVTAAPVNKLRNSAYNATSIRTDKLSATARNLGDALGAAPGVKIRESGGVGSDMQVSLDGFSGKHVKIFIDGIPQEGLGESFGINNIPVNYAERIDVYRGVVPVGFGADAIGGVINIVTSRRKRRWFAEASYSFGSFNTHKSLVNAGQTLQNGFTYEINAFQNYSDNDYWVDAPVEDFKTGAIDRNKLERVRRFHDNYHNEAVIGRLGFTGKPWADRLMLAFNYSHMYQEIQTGVRQAVVYGGKHRHGHTLMPSLEYSKRNLLADGLDAAITASYSRNYVTNVDTASVKYNWRGDTSPLSSPGEQSLQLSQSVNNNWSAAATLNYRLGVAHLFTVNDVFQTFNRRNENLLTTPHSRDEFGKLTTKNILGASYRYTPIRELSLSVFGKYYHQYVSGPIAASSAQDVYVLNRHSAEVAGYGAAATWMMPLGFLIKASYEKACRLPTIEELFGNEDLEIGDIKLKPESSHNVNLNLSYTAGFGRNSIYAEAGFVYRATRDYIQRNILALSGGKSAATYINYGRVDTKGFNLSVRYSYGRWVSAGGNFTLMNARDDMKTAAGSTAPNLSYRQRMPNLPYMFADLDATFSWHGLGGRGNVLSLTYDTQYTHSFSYYTSNIGTSNRDYIVPTQICHNLTLSYGIRRGRYTLSLECRNLSDARLYDNFSLQKAGRAFYGKIRIYFGG